MLVARNPSKNMRRPRSSSRDTDVTIVEHPRVDAAAVAAGAKKAKPAKQSGRTAAMNRRAPTP